MILDAANDQRRAVQGLGCAAEFAMHFVAQALIA